MGKKVITAAYIHKVVEAGETCLELCSKNCIVTPGARDVIDELGLTICEEAPPEVEATNTRQTSSTSPQSSTTSSGTSGNISKHVYSLLRDQLPGQDSTDLEALIRRVVEAKLAGYTAPPQQERNSLVTVQGNVSLINSKNVFDKTTSPDLPGKVTISDAIKCHPEAQHSTTFMQWSRGSFDRTVEKPEMHLVVEGSLEVSIDGRRLNAQAGDMLYLHKGAQLTYSTPDHVKITCINI